MNELTIGVLALLAIGFVAFPLVRVKYGDAAVAAEDTAQADEGDPALAALLSQRDATYRAIKEIEFDREIGSLSEEDYRDLRERYKMKALGLLKAIKEHEQQAGLDPGARAAPAAAAEAIERAVSRRRTQKGGPTCLHCGALANAGARFCHSCGRELASGCPACGAPHGSDDRFCIACGARLNLAGKAALGRR